MFVANLKEAGWNVWDPAEVVGHAHTVCEALRKGDGVVVCARRGTVHRSAAGRVSGDDAEHLGRAVRTGLLEIGAAVLPDVSAGICMLRRRRSRRCPGRAASHRPIEEHLVRSTTILIVSPG